MTFFTVPEATCKLRPSHVAEVKLLTYVTPRSRARIYSNYHSTLEPESKGGSAVLDFDFAVGVGMIIGVKSQKCRGLERMIGGRK